MHNKTKKGNLPNLIIIGASKCGTTSLHYYLGLHPQIYMSAEKELNFFNSPVNWNKGIDWYKSKFIARADIFGESSVGYTHPFRKGVAERMYSIIPETRLIYILRDPVERIISEYVHNYSDGVEARSIDETIKDFGTNTYVLRSKYFMQLEQYIDLYPKSNILIFTTEEMYTNRSATLQKVFEFLNVDATFNSPDFYRLKHESSMKRRKNNFGLLLKRISETNIAKIFSPDLRRNIGRVLYLPFSDRIERPVLESGLRQRLIKYLEDDIKCLRDYSGQEFKDWCV